MNDKNKKVELKFLDGIEFEKKYIDEILDRIPKETLDVLNNEWVTVNTNIKYIKDLGINNYQDAFLRFYNMFLIEPGSFDGIFSKYDKDDLVVKLEKNIAIMEHL